MANIMYDTADAVNRVLKADKIQGDGQSLLSPGLPDDHWAQEVMGWENYLWATYQAFVTDYGVGYAARDPSVREIMKQNLTAGEKRLCGVQKMRKSGGFM
jgi:hypothetical protein